MSIAALLGSVILLCMGYLFGWVLYEQYSMLKERNHRRKVREELDRIFRDR